jgi:LysM repeat protein
VSTPPPGPPAKGGASGLAAKAGGKRNLLIAAAVGTAAVAFLMSRGGGSKTPNDGTADQIMTGYDSTPYDTYNALQQQLEDIQNQIDEGKVTPGTPTTPPTTPAAPKPPPKTIPWVPAKPKPVPSKPKPPTKPGTPPPKNVVIKRGDTLSGIAKKAGISMTTLKKLNPGFWSNKKYNNGNTIFAGGKVRVK